MSALPCVAVGDDAAARTDESPQYCCVLLRFSSMSLLLHPLRPAPLTRPTTSRGLPQVRSLVMAPALRMRAIGGAAVVLLAIRLAPFAYAKTARLATLRIVQRAVGSQAAATPEHIVWESERLYDEARYACAAEHLARAVDMRSPYAHALLSTLLVEGRPGLPRDHARAFRLAAAGAELGCVHSKGALGRCFSGGFGVAQDALQAHALAEHSAASGSRFGMFVLAVCYEHGEGVGVDMEMAISLWRRAADQRHASAQYNLGVALKRGNNPADAAEAVCLWTLAAAQGHAQAQVALGLMYHTGDVVLEDKAEAVRLWRVAAGQGNTVAQFNLGVVLLADDGVAQDVDEAARWFRSAASQGHRNAAIQLARMGVRFEPP